MIVKEITKRLLDLIGASTALALTMPIMASAALAVGASMGHPILFRQERPGLAGRPFILYKFRTMREPGPAESSAESDAERLVLTGKLLRSLSLDELPTLYNVIKGDMSLVGPRPLLMQYLDRYSLEQARRHEVKPGITGWAQVNGRNALTWEEKFSFDVWYVENHNLLLDLRIMAMTVFKVLKREGISHAGQETMPEFMGS
ncbi:MAG: sugar transferase [Deltaproteobacteria bacterium]|nr:sugar transferase [Deltaproteobacteria bacterium]